MSTLLDRVTDLNDSILEGRALEAFEKYYHNDVVMQENNAEPTIGKEANRTREEEFFGNVTNQDRRPKVALQQPLRTWVR